MSQNLMEGLLSEMNRVREIIAEYDKIPAGYFVAAFMRDSVKNAETAIAENDVVKMLGAHQDLKEWEL